MSYLAFFTETSIPQQSKVYGVLSADKFRVSSLFTISTSIKAYAMVRGTILLQQQATDADKVNLILRPHNQKELKLPVKYIIYRGLSITDFIHNNDLTNPANQVNTSGSELLAAMQVIQQGRAPEDDIPLEALFGNDLTPANDKNIDEFFFKNLAPSSQLFTIDCGIELGSFATGEIGIEIVLENPEFFVDVELVKEEKFLIEINSNMTSAEKKWQKDLVRHFVDPAAFYGLHYDIKGGIEYRDSNGDVNDPPADTKELVYDIILKPFKETTRNSVYLDIRNENGYSYNYYGNYVGTGTDADKELEIGPSPTGLTKKEYYTNGWAMHIVDVITPGSNEENEFSIALRVNDNERPLLAGWSVELSPYSEVDPPLSNDTSNRVYFTDETHLLPTPIPNPLPAFTNAITVKVPNVPSETKQLATMVKLDYIKQLIPLSDTTKFPRINFTDYIFGPLNVDIPWDIDDKIQWIETNHRTCIDTTSEGYVLGQYKTTILSIDLTTNEIEIFDEVPVELSKQVTLEYTNGNPPTTYTPNKITFDNGKTKIEVNETITTALQTGDQLTLTVRLDGGLDYENNKFIIRNIDYTNLEVLSSGNQLDFYSIEFLNTYDIGSITFNSPNTEVTFSNAKHKAGIAGFVETGILLEDDTLNTGNSDNDRILFYTTPTNTYIKKANKKKSKFERKGGTLNKSFADALKRLLPDAEFEKIVLDITPEPVSTFSLSSKKKAKEVLFLLGLTRVEWDAAKTAIGTNFHQKLFKLLSTTNSKTDGDGNRYYEYELQVAGEDASGDFQVVNTGVKVYSIDRLVYVSAEFGKRFDIDTTLAMQTLDDFINQTLYYNGKDFRQYKNSKFNLNPPNGKEFNFSEEEWGNLSNDRSWIPLNKELFDLDSSMKIKIEEIKTALDDSNVKTKGKIKRVLREKGADLLKHAKAHIKGEDPDTGNPITPTPNFVNKDGILYLTRLIISVIIRNHPKIRTKYGSKVQDFLDEFEKHSRGLEGTEKPTFPTQTSTHFNILISGFDPFSGGQDWDNHISNPSGNLVLSLDGEVIPGADNSGKEATIKSAIFPVRFREFDKDWIEDFFTSYINDTNIKMIITFSYGFSQIHNTHSSISYFNLDRMASNYRASIPDNNNYIPPDGKIITYSDDAFIENALGINDGNEDYNDYSEWIDSDNKFYLNQTYEGTIDGKDGSGNILPTKNIFSTRVDSIYSNLIDFPQTEDSNNFEPDYVSDRKITAHRGSGGTYLSNEIHYRVSFLRKDTTKRTGHIHVGFLKSNKDGYLDDNREIMLGVIKNVLEKVTKNF